MHVTLFLLFPGFISALRLSSCLTHHAVLESLDLLLQLLHEHFVVFDSAHNLRLSNAVADGGEPVGTPEEPINLDALDRFYYRVVVGPAIPGLDVKENRDLCRDLRVLVFLFVVGLHPHLLELLLLLGVILRFATKKIHAVIVARIVGGGSSTSG